MTQEWKIPEQWWSEHTSSDLVYRVVFECSEFTQEWWGDLCADGNMDGDALLLGGASLEFLGEQRIAAASGGEDALDSLEFAVQDVLLETVPGDCPVTVVDAQRTRAS